MSDSESAYWDMLQEEARKEREREYSENRRKNKEVLEKELEQLLRNLHKECCTAHREMMKMNYGNAITGLTEAISTTKFKCGKIGIEL